MISGFFFEPNAAIFLIYALRRSPRAPPPGNKVLKELPIGYGPGVFCIDFMRLLSETECAVMKLRASFARMRLRRYISVARTYNPNYTCAPQYVISASEAGIRHSRTVFGGQQIWGYSIFQYYYSNVRSARAALPLE